MATPAPDSLIKEIEGALARLEHLDHYQRIGVPRNADPAAIRKAYTSAAAKWHPDRFTQHDLGDHAPKLQRVFALITESHTVLSNAARREQYDAELNLGASGNGRKVNAIDVFEADRLFRVGQKLLEGGKAKAALENFDQACRLNPDSGVFRAFRLFAEFQTLSRDQKGVLTDKKRASELKKLIVESSETVEKFDMGYVFQGFILMEEGDEKNARKMFMMASSINPKNVQAQRQLRLMNMRMDNKESLMDKLMGFLKKKH